MTYFFETYGCQMNSAESAALVVVLKEHGWVPADSGEQADLVLINTCAVRATAEQRALGRIAHYAALKKSRTFSLIVAGCMASRLGRKIGADFVLGTHERNRFPAILESIKAGTHSIETDEKPVFSFSPLHLEEGKSRAFVPIMHGCSNFCTYCIVPYVRGPEIARDPDSIYEEIRILGDRGVREIVLLGQNVNSYRWEAVDFPALLEKSVGAIQGTGIRWIRFLSANPADVSPRTIEVLQEYPVFCRHLHLPFQSGSSRILAAMNRRYNRQQYLDLIASIRNALPDITFSADILVGFPGETEADFAETVSLMEEVHFLLSFMYHYNPREGTKAFDLPDRVPDPVKLERLDRVITLQKQHTQTLLHGRIGATVPVLIEGISRKNTGELLCHTEHEEMVVVPGSPASVNSFATLKLSGLRGNTFYADYVP
ncbi:tRNA-2-methylthio-N(6)-dimethylallyladenosine synthase [Spirochaetia bacterium]|nr:tRNA-2-methylthio-N(6)-dimethylallyladenosine synthase [Spirochaetia bacterium]GHU35875.1 tRNA-2-methylthio-N(6)-dimethylallyladenosine synthase [Spirochaetia bacterium]